MDNSYNIWNKWSKLETVMLGRCYPTSFFNDIKNKRIRDSLMRITEETTEDLDYFDKVLRDFGCKVLRPKIDPNANIMDYIDDQGRCFGPQGVPRSPLQPRDCQLVIGNNLYYTSYDHPGIKQELDEYNQRDTIGLFARSRDDLKLAPKMSEEAFNILSGSDWKAYQDYVSDHYFDNMPQRIIDEFCALGLPIFDIPNFAPNITVIGKDIYIDQHREGINVETMIRSSESSLSLFKKKLKGDFRLNSLTIGGHNDGCFHTIKPGAIISLVNIQEYANTFPDWDVCYFPEQGWRALKGFVEMRGKVGGKWWIPGEEDNDELTNFVETWLKDWIGYVEETVFDVNVLVLDEHHVCVSNINPTIVEFLKKHRMEPIHVPWRHRFFWDGGLHCITLDLKRKGIQEDYFPNRIDPITDWGLD